MHAPPHHTASPHANLPTGPLLRSRRGAQHDRRGSHLFGNRSLMQHAASAGGWADNCLTYASWKHILHTNPTMHNTLPNKDTAQEPSKDQQQESYDSVLPVQLPVQLVWMGVMDEHMPAHPSAHRTWGIQ